MIRGIILDFGHVLILPRADHALSFWESHLGRSGAELRRLIYGGEMGLKALRGDITDDDLWIWAQHRFSLSTEQGTAFRDAFRDNYALDARLLEHIRHLRPRYKTAIVSNAPSNLRAHIEHVYKISHLFDLVVCSAEEHVLKPDPEIYRRALDRLDLAPGEAIFIDDTEENIASARTFGMNGIVFGPGIDIQVELERLGVA